MSKADVYSSKGVKGGSVSLPKDFSEKENYRLLAQAIRVYNDSLHIGIAKVKTRAEVDRTKKKIYKQKGTGGARHGSRSAPIYVGGGVAHGPKPYSRKLVLPKRLAKKALNVALSLKAKENKVVVVSGLGNVAKTKDIMTFVSKFRKAEGVKTRFTFALSEENQKQARSLTNITGVNAVPFRNLNAYRVFFGGILVLDKEIFNEVKSDNSKVKTIKEEIKK